VAPAVVEGVAVAAAGAAAGAAADDVSATDVAMRTFEELAEGGVSEADREEIDHRALTQYRGRVSTLPPQLSGVSRRGHAASSLNFGGGCCGGSGGAGGGGGGGGRRRKPCSECQVIDKRDALVCSKCHARLHLMCMWPPLEDAPAESWECDQCRSAVPPLRTVPQPGEELEAEVQENEANGGAVVWKRAVVLSSKPKERFVLMINPDEVGCCCCCCLHLRPRVEPLDYRGSSSGAFCVLVYLCICAAL
jgi:hypothetical protein